MAKNPKTKAEIIAAEIEAIKQACLENEIYPLLTVGLTFDLDANGTPRMIPNESGAGINMTVKNPALKNKDVFTILQTAYQAAKNTIVNQSKNNLKKIN